VPDCYPIGELYRAILAVIRLRIHNGEWTERGLARAAGLSQPHTNNILAGKRIGGYATIDALCRACGIQLPEVIAETQLQRTMARAGHPAAAGTAAATRPAATTPGRSKQASA
jgi:transcriptional regulator with XRE-family HTH domain